MKPKRASLLAVAVSMAMTAVLSASAVKAEVIGYTFQSSNGSLTLTGTLTVDQSGQVTNMTGTFSGLFTDAVNGVIANSSFPNAMNTSSQGGYFITYDNALDFGSDPLLTNAGIAFTATGTSTNNPPDIWNVFSDGPGAYELVDLSGSGIALDVLGNFTAPAPQPGQGTLALFAFAALVTFAGGRKTRASRHQ